MSRRVSDLVAADRAAALARVRRELSRERKARERLVLAQQASGSALALARMAGVPWSQLSAEAGMSRPSLLERLSRWGGERAEGTRFTQPSAVVTATDPMHVDDGGGDFPELWLAEMVQVSVRHALEWVQMETRRELAEDPDADVVVETSADRVRRAGVAALGVVREMAAGAEDPDPREAAIRSSQEAARVVPFAGGSSDGDLV